ncbi:GntR family transcriptional regulator [Variovorax sp. PBL-E5]|uniref:GntR family transcriptional regulator n=1 Tax=Variovorax sp. PBL-E5 TaxID=434014 RepID=UPI0013182EE1|nr:GntR family transcriptional regulator [Variovorax sp. PBL-E5]VTU30280.1 HTH-type transcriptional repressor YvoA [Variovorax sp. PBL-E5]
MNALLENLERESDRSLYEQVTDRLRGHLVANMAVGQQLPTEAELVEVFSVSRSTVRKAVQQLVDEGVLTRRQGKGTFMARPTPKIVHSIDRLAPFMETFRNAGEDLHTELIHFGWVDSPSLPDALQAWDKPVLSYQRLYVSGGIPHAVTRIDLPHHLGRKLSQSDVEAQPLYNVLSKKLRISLSRAEFLVSCRQPTPELSQKLELSQSTFLLVLERITRDTDGNPVEMTTHFLRPDVYQLSVALDDVHARKS